YVASLENALCSSTESEKESCSSLCKTPLERRAKRFVCKKKWNHFASLDSSSEIIFVSLSSTVFIKICLQPRQVLYFPWCFPLNWFLSQSSKKQQQEREAACHLQTSRLRSACRGPALINYNSN